MQSVGFLTMWLICDFIMNRSMCGVMSFIFETPHPLSLKRKENWLDAHLQHLSSSHMAQFKYLIGDYELYKQLTN